MAAGRHWRLSIGELHCEGALLVAGTSIRYLGPKGLVEAPVIRLRDGAGRTLAPRSLVWRRGSKRIAEWLSGGGVTNLQTADIGEVQLKFAPQAGGELRLEFGDIAAFDLTSQRQGVCDGLLKPEQIRAPAAPPAPEGKASLRIYRGTYPCLGSAQTIEAQYPPYLPQQLLLLGRSYLPNAREIALPMGSAAAQPYLYSGKDDLDAVEDAARRALGARFSPGTRAFAFNWGTQRTPGGNEAYSVGIYELRPCPK